MIYHITTPEHLARFEGLDYYEADSLTTEGFIHCSTRDQLEATAGRYYAQANEIKLLCIEESKLTAALKYEAAKTGEEFPHIYGRINKSAVEQVITFTQNGSGYTFNGV